MATRRCSIGGEKIPDNARIGTMSDIKRKRADCIHTNMGLVCASHISDYRGKIAQITGGGPNKQKFNAGGVNKRIRMYIPQI